MATRTVTITEPVPYQLFRTGLSFAQVRAMLWVDNPDPGTWKRKSRGCVLRLWRKLKEDMYEEYVRRHTPTSPPPAAVTWAARRTKRRLVPVKPEDVVPF